jgi:hypothetical protein
MMQAPRKGSFWDQPTDASMYRYLLVRLVIGLAVGTIAWFVGHGILRALIHR